MKWPWVSKLKNMLIIVVVVALLLGAITGGAFLLMKLDGVGPREAWTQQCRDDGYFLQYEPLTCVAADGTIIRQYIP